MSDLVYIDDVLLLPRDSRIISTGWSSQSYQNGMGSTVWYETIRCFTYRGDEIVPLEYDITSGVLREVFITKDTVSRGDVIWKRNQDINVQLTLNGFSVQPQPTPTVQKTRSFGFAGDEEDSWEEVVLDRDILRERAIAQWLYGGDKVIQVPDIRRQSVNQAALSLFATSIRGGHLDKKSLNNEWHRKEQTGLLKGPVGNESIVAWNTGGLDLPPSLHPLANWIRGSILLKQPASHSAPTV